MTNLSVGILFHREGLISVPAVDSLARTVAVARASGIDVEVLCILDRADEPTRRLIGSRRHNFDRVLETDFGDPARARNEAIRLSRGDYVAMVDGDDLWGERWLAAAFIQASGEMDDRRSIWHPEWLFLFTEADFVNHVTGALPSPEAKAHFVRQVDSLAAEFDPAYLLIENLWSANSLYHRSIAETWPYPHADATLGLGIEDWAWNTMTFGAGVHHRVVPDTVHMIRMKETGSLNASNVRGGVLPDFPAGTWTNLSSKRSI